MEERQVTVDAVSRPVPDPFFTIATQNPVEYQGTFPLPEAQMDRFALSLSLGYPSEAEELQMLEHWEAGVPLDQLQPCISLEEVQALRRQCARVRVETHLQKYILRLVRSTRDREEIALGISPRGAVALQRSAQALAFLEGREFVTPDDVKFLTPHVLSHRLIPTGGRKADTIVEQLLLEIAVEE
jgi:MoxR-like ATPase